MRFFRKLLEGPEAAEAAEIKAAEEVAAKKKRAVIEEIDRWLRNTILKIKARYNKLITKHQIEMAKKRSSKA